MSFLFEITRKQVSSNNSIMRYKIVKGRENMFTTHTAVNKEKYLVHLTSMHAASKPGNVYTDLQPCWEVHI